MDYDYRKGRGSGHMGAVPPYDSSSQRMPLYGRAPYDRVGSYGQSSSSFYPTVGQASSSAPISRPPPPIPVSSSSGAGIRVTIKPEYRITPPPQLSPHMGEIPRSTFQFDFDFERKILADLEKDSQNWSKIVSEMTKNAEPSSSGSSEDQLTNKYVAMGLNREAVALALANFGDNPNKIHDFATSYSLLREMGFPSHTIASVLAMYDNDRDKALAHFLNSSS